MGKDCADALKVMVNFLMDNTKPCPPKHGKWSMFSSISSWITFVTTWWYTKCPHCRQSQRVGMLRLIKSQWFWWIVPRSCCPSHLVEHLITRTLNQTPRFHHSREGLSTSESFRTDGILIPLDSTLEVAVVCVKPFGVHVYQEGLEQDATVFVEVLPEQLCNTGLCALQAVCRNTRSSLLIDHLLHVSQMLIWLKFVGVPVLGVKRSQILLTGTPWGMYWGIHWSSVQSMQRTVLDLLPVDREMCPVYWALIADGRFVSEK